MTKKRYFSILVILAILIITVGGFVYNRNSNAKTAYHAEGSAGNIAGTTIVVSLFADDTESKWDSTEDAEKISNINNYLAIAGDYLENVVASYNKSADFITDFTTNTDLKYSMAFDKKITDQEYIDNGECDTVVWDFIDKNIDEDALKQKYNADNIVYMVFVDSDESNTAITCTRSWYEGMESDDEIVYLFNIDSQCLNGPAVYAHEILHTFGAPDLYVENPLYNITSDFLNYVNESMSNDLMLTCSDATTGDYLYDSINNEVGEVTAYFLGLVDSSKIVDQWNLVIPETY